MPHTYRYLTKGDEALRCPPLVQETIAYSTRNLEFTFLSLKPPAIPGTLMRLC